MPGDVEELRRVYADFHPEARALLAACDSVTKSALYVRDPLPVWSRGSSDAAGRRLPSDGALHGPGRMHGDRRCHCARQRLAGIGRADIGTAFKRYEGARKERTARVQIGSRGNEWLREGGNADWVYGYDAGAVKWEQINAQ